MFDGETGAEAAAADDDPESVRVGLWGIRSGQFVRQQQLIILLKNRIRAPLSSTSPSSAHHPLAFSVPIVNVGGRGVVDRQYKKGKKLSQ